MTNELPSRKADALWRMLGWAGAVAALLVTFVHDWTVPVLGTDWRPKRGHLLLEASAVIELSLIGSLIGGWWWSAVGSWRRVGAAAIALWSIAGMAGWISREIFWSGW
ncbi:MAG: hypothetical protein JNG86_17960, partial [Verrucomicrobiaceae bacterium]|nr:hypothetical protein [Verrucomicrobiaceae bacterium]